MNFWGLLFTFSIMAAAYDPSNVVVTGHELPPELKAVDVKDRLGQAIDLNLQFTAENGEPITLASLFQRGRPVIMAMVYYNCPSLCNYHLNGLSDTMKTLKWGSGKDYEFIAVSMDHSETADLAKNKKNNYWKAYQGQGDPSGWHFLVGSEQNVKALADQLGFQFQWLPEQRQFAHAAVTYVLTPEGKISRQIHGIQPDAMTLKLSLLEASNGKIGSVLEKALMFCFQFDPKKNKYTIYAWNLMRIGAILMVLLLAVLVGPVWWREQVRNRSGM